MKVTLQVAAPIETKNSNNSSLHSHIFLVVWTPQTVWLLGRPPLFSHKTLTLGQRFTLRRWDWHQSVNRVPNTWIAAGMSLNWRVRVFSYSLSLSYWELWCSNLSDVQPAAPKVLSIWTDFEYAAETYHSKQEVQGFCSRRVPLSFYQLSTQNTLSNVRRACTQTESRVVLNLHPQARFKDDDIFGFVCNEKSLNERRKKWKWWVTHSNTSTWVAVMSTPHRCPPSTSNPTQEWPIAPSSSRPCQNKPTHSLPHACFL